MKRIIKRASGYLPSIGDMSKSRDDKELLCRNNDNSIIKPDSSPQNGFHQK